MKAFKRTLSIVMAVLMIVGVVVQNGVGTMTAKAANIKTHCLYFFDVNGNPMTNVLYEYAVATDEQTANWITVNPNASGAYIFSYDFDEIENDQSLKLYTHWDTYGVLVAPVNGKASSLTGFSDYAELVRHYSGGQMNDYYGQNKYDFAGTYSAEFVQFYNQYNTMNCNYIVTNPAKWAIILYQCNGASPITPADFVNNGALVTATGKNSTTVNGTGCDYYMFYSDGNTGYSSYPNSDNSFVNVDVGSIINNQFYNVNGSYFLAAYPMDSNGAILENAGTSFMYPLYNSGNGGNNGGNPGNPATQNPYPDGLEFCYTFDEFTGTVPSDAHWDKQWSTQCQCSNGHSFIARTNINGVITPVADADAKGFTADKGMTITATNATVSDGTYTYVVYHWNTPNPDWYTVSYGGYSKWIEIDSGNNSGNNTPGPNQNNSYGLKAVWGVSTYDCKLGDNPWWDGPNAWQPVSCTNMSFVLKYTDSDGTVKHLTGADLSDLDVTSRSGTNTMKISDTKKTTVEDGYTIFEWEIPQVIDTYTFSYKGSNLVVDIRYSDIGFYTSTSQSSSNILCDNSYSNNKYVSILADTISSNEKYNFISVKTSYRSSDESPVVSEDVLAQQESTFVKSWTTVTDLQGNIIGYTLEFKDEWPSELDDVYGFSIDIQYSYSNNSSNICCNNQWINRYGNNPGWEGPSGGLLFTNSIDYNDDGTITLPWGIDCGTYNQDYLYGREADFVFKYTDSDGNVSPVTIQDLVIPNGITFTGTGKSVYYEGIAYPIYHATFADCIGDYVISMVGTDDWIDLHITYPEVAFYSGNALDIDNMYGMVRDNWGYLNPDTVLYKPGQSIYAIANAKANYMYGSVIESVIARYYDETKDDFVEITDTSSLFDIEWEYDTIHGEQCKVAAKITFKTSWSSFLMSKGINEYQLLALRKFYNDGGVEAYPANGINDGYWECVYVNNFFEGCNAVVDDNIKMNFFCSLDDLYVQDSSTKVIIDYGTGRYEYTADDFNRYCNGEGFRNTEYIFPCELAASQMSQKITLSLSYKGEVLASYSVNFLTFAKAIKSHPSSSEKMVEMIDLLLNYGAYAQQYFGNNTDNLANNGIYAEGENPVEKISSETVKSEIAKAFENDNVLGTPIAENDYVELYGTSLTCRDKVSFNIYLKVKGGVDVSSIRVEGGYNVVGTVVNSGLYKITISEINACNLNDIYELAVTGGNGWLVPIKVTPFTYIYEAQNSNNQNLVNLTKAIYLYQQAAEGYVREIHPEQWETEICK